MTDDILVRTEGGMGVLSLNRPKAIHALNRAMVDGMLPEDDGAVAVGLSRAWFWACRAGRGTS